MNATRTGLVLIALLAWLPAAAAPGASSQEIEDKQVISAAIRGPAEVNLHDQAVLSLPAGTAFLPRAAAATLLGRMGNVIRPDLLGLVVGGGDWMVVMEYTSDGHVPDADTKSLESKTMMRRLQAETADDRHRREQGLEVLHTSRWLELPHYDSGRHQLSWGVEYETIANSRAIRKSANRTAVALGRSSRIGLDLVTNGDDAQKTTQILPALLAGLNFLPGCRYQDFDPAKDKSAPYNLSQMIAN